MATITEVETKQIHALSFKTISTIATWALAILLIGGPTFLHTVNGVGISPILTNSMTPFAHAGDVFLTVPTKASELKIGEIIAIHNQKTGEFYAHRIIAISTVSNLLQFTTKGDANGAPEATPYLIGANKTVSREFMKIDWVGRPLAYLASTLGREAMISLIVIANLAGLYLLVFRKKEEI